VYRGGGGGDDYHDHDHDHDRGGGGGGGAAAADDVTQSLYCQYRPTPEAVTANNKYDS